MHDQIGISIQAGAPLSVGRLGAVEAEILVWREKLASIGPFLQATFADTGSGSTNAGIRPRNRHSYEVYADLLRLSLDSLDIQGVWQTGAEAICLPDSRNRRFVLGEGMGRSPSNPRHWLSHITRKRVLIVSPFCTSIHRQIPRLHKVWPQSEWSLEAEFICIPFPYLIDERCPETWWEVYNRIGATVLDGDYDIALFGCGGLGLPLASLAKRAGKIGIHLGGHLQLIFGVYGSRHLRQPWFSEHINSSWIRPCASEVPSCASSVEQLCYW